MPSAPSASRSPGGHAQQLGRQSGFSRAWLGERDIRAVVRPLHAGAPSSALSVAAPRAAALSGPIRRGRITAELPTSSSCAEGNASSR